jgi:glycerate dehydrogenase
MNHRATFLDFATVSFQNDLDLTSLRRALPGIELHATSTEAEIAARIASVEVLLTNKLRITRERMAQAPNLKLIALTATGTNNVDLDAARERGIGVCNIRDYCTPSVAQHVLGVTLLLTHKLREYGRAAVDGTWGASPQFTVLDYPIRELAGKTLGIVGYGALGRGTARVMQAALGMRLLVAQRVGTGDQSSGRTDDGHERVPLSKLLAESDVISLHCPLNPQTEKMIGAREFALMKRDALLVNTARGALIDIDALAQALRHRIIGGAAIDVLPEEPPVSGSPLFADDLPNLVVTPHVAWAAIESRQRAIDELAANVEDFFRGGRRGRVV